MGPYEILGVPRDCTRAEAKEAFRARVRRAHPDRGGDVPAFIRLRTAYEQILAELERNPEPKPDPVARASRPDRAARPPDPDWDPELVVLDETPRGDRPPRPFDLDWEPEVVLLDEDLQSGRSDEPSDASPARRTDERGRQRDRPRSLRRFIRFDTLWMCVVAMVTFVLAITLLRAIWSDTDDTVTSGPPGSGRPQTPSRGRPGR
jgi:curved DNA-binding protein CbpA